METMTLTPPNVVGQWAASSQAATRQSDGDSDTVAMGIGELAAHIVQTHHAYLREALPRIEFLIQKLVAVHGEQDPSFAELFTVFKTLHVGMQSHMDKEENVLFPMAAVLERGIQPPMNLMHLVRCMEQEHEDADEALDRICELTNDFVPPKHACSTWRAAFSALAELDADMHRHAHKENNVLFPRIVEMQKQAGKIKCSLPCL